MTRMISIAQAFENWKSEIMPAVVAQYGKDDYPALSESWNDYTDSLCKDGELCDLQYQHCPAWDDEMPDNDQAFILDEMGLKFAPLRISERPDVKPGEWDAGSSHWRILLQRNGAEMTTYYSMGSAHTGEPESSDVIHCLLSDADSAEESFEDWCASLGYDEDSRRAERTYNACRETAQRLRLLFSESELSDLRELFSDY